MPVIGSWAGLQNLKCITKAPSTITKSQSTAFNLKLPFKCSVNYSALYCIYSSRNKEKLLKVNILHFSITTCTYTLYCLCRNRLLQDTHNTFSNNHIALEQTLHRRLNYIDSTVIIRISSTQRFSNAVKWKDNESTICDTHNIRNSTVQARIMSIIIQQLKKKSSS